ncbi:MULTISPECIES: EAL domain-containing response regulator [Silvimonas]|uniref:EAL domain-containing response regulator n=1 Tax=Silvimonas TaxID=300264 RepID=UPI0024B39C3D|nr:MULTISPECIES: EAL domain-containing response regulator [Silvimonas]MDR3430208.1 EAL domain-containing response regulator [Silvimonas sp.]
MPNARPSMLIADDSSLQLNHAVELCVQYGCEVIWQAMNGQEVLTLLASLPERPDILLTDLEMPGMDGVELLRHLAENDILMPIIFMSSTDEQVLHAVEAAALAYGFPVLGTLQKPMAIDELNAALDHFTPVNQPAFSPAPAVDVSDMVRALDASHFVPWFQPKVTTRSGLFQSAEVLARWMHPELGMIAPVHFVPFMEKSGLIGRLTEQIMVKAMRETKLLYARGLKFGLAVNISAENLPEPGFAERIKSLLAQESFPPGQMTLEITESGVIADLARSLGALARLRMAGVGISIDDYGTGNATLQQLMRTPCSELKIDRAFVNGASRRPQLRTLLESTVEMAHRLKLIVVAEGVEDAEDWKLVQELGVELVQGYFVAKPMPGEKIHEWVRNRHEWLHLWGKLQNC